MTFLPQRWLEGVNYFNAGRPAQFPIPGAMCALLGRDGLGSVYELALWVARRLEVFSFVLYLSGDFGLAETR